MVQFEIKSEKMKEWFPETYKIFLEELKNSKSACNNKKEEDIKWEISWGFFSAKAKTEEEAVLKQIDYDKKLKLVYDERCKADLPKLRISIFMKAGYRIIGDRSFDKGIPQYIIDMFYEVMKITMLQEQIILKDPVVMESLEEFVHLLQDLMDELGIQIEGTEDFTKRHKEEPLSMDDILDKISESGMQSLSARELKFLEKQSRG